MEHTKIEYDRKKAFGEFEREYKYAYERIAKPKKWLASGEIAALMPFDKAVRAELETKRESEEDVLAMKCRLEVKPGFDSGAVKMAVYWLMEDTLKHCPKLRHWYSWCGKDRSLGEMIVEKKSGMDVAWRVDLREFYSEEVWA